MLNVDVLFNLLVSCFREKKNLILLDMKVNCFLMQTSYLVVSNHYFLIRKYTHDFSLSFISGTAFMTILIVTTTLSGFQAVYYLNTIKKVEGTHSQKHWQISSNIITPPTKKVSTYIKYNKCPYIIGFI